MILEKTFLYKKSCPIYRRSLEMPLVANESGDGLHKGDGEVHDQAPVIRDGHD